MGQGEKDAIPVCIGYSTALAFWLSAGYAENTRYMLIDHPFALADGIATLNQARRTDLSQIYPPGVRGIRTHVLVDRFVHAGKSSHIENRIKLPAVSIGPRSADGRGTTPGVIPCGNQMFREIVCHEWPKSSPANSFVWLGGTVCIATPALTVVMAATQLGVPETVEIINALYGSYAIDGRGKLVPRTPILTPKTLWAYLDAAPNDLPGIIRARKAAALALPGAESPKEAAIAVVMRCDAQSGGGGLRRLTLNHEIGLTAEARAFVDTKNIRFDGFVGPTRSHVKQQPVAYDFDSIMFHAGDYYRFGSGAPGEELADRIDGRDAINKDSRRKSCALEMGVIDVTLTTDDVADRTIFYAKVSQIRRLSGMRELPRGKDAEGRRKELHGLMLNSLRFLLRPEERLDRAMQVRAERQRLAQLQRKKKCTRFPRYRKAPLAALLDFGGVRGFASKNGLVPADAFAFGEEPVLKSA